MSKLIIRHGARVTEHVLADHPLVVGRDPQCDLFFADKKLSRRHARFEHDEQGVRLVDLGSRNGCWVNEERVDERILSSSDAVRLGSLMIQLEADEPSDDAESTVLLNTKTSGEASGEDSRTVVLSAKDLPDAQSDETGTLMLAPSEAPSTPEDDSSTRIVPASELSEIVGDEDATLRKPDTAAEADSSATMMLGGEPRPDVAPETGTVIFRGKAAPAVDDATRIASEPLNQAPEIPLEVDAPVDMPLIPEQGSWDVSGGPRSAPSTFRFVVLVAAVAVLALLVLAVPLMRTLGNALTTESALRGRTLVELLAATNEGALRENRPERLDVAHVTSQPGVVGAYILDPMGRTLAPAASSSVAPLLAGLGVDVKDIRAFRESSGSDGTTVYALPVRAQGRRLGIALMQYRPGAAVSTWTAVMLALGSALLLMGVAAAVVMARRWTLLPVQELRDDVEALRHGLVESLVEDRPYSDLATIARSFNELAGRDARDTGTVGGGTATLKPELDPTLIPEDRGDST